MKTIFDFRAFLNFLRRNKLYTAINIVGFSVSLAVVILLVCYIRHEQSVDQFQQNKERTYLALSNYGSTFAAPVGPELQTRYPEIEEFVRTSLQTTTAHYQENKLQAKLLLTDPSFFRVFSFQLTEGDRNEALKNRNALLISEEFAHKLFGTTEGVIGRQVELLIDQEKVTVPVSSILKTFPPSHMSTPDLMLQYEAWLPVLTRDEQIIRNHNNFSFGLYLMSRTGSDLPARQPDIFTYCKETYAAYQLNIFTSFQLERLDDIYLAPAIPESNILLQQGDRKLITMLLSVALLILLFSVINYVNLSVAQTESRAREMAVRRLLGCPRRMLFIRMIIESVILCTLSFIIALLLAYMIQPLFNAMLHTDILLTAYSSPLDLLGAAGIVLLLGCITGIVPAIVITNFKPVEVVKGSLKRKTKMVYNKIMIGFQYFITIALIGCTLTMTRQLDYLMHANRGFDSSGVLIVENTGLNRQQANGLKNEWLQIAGVENVSLAQGTPVTGSNGRSVTTYRDKPLNLEVFKGDSAYFDIMGFTIIRDNHNHDRRAVWFNEAAMEAAELADTVSYFEPYQSPIAGIVKNFNTNDLTEPTGPVVIYKLQEWHIPDEFLIKIQMSQLDQVYKQVQQVYDRYTQNAPFKAQFSDALIQQMYEKQQRTAQILGWFTLIAIIISTLGILAMATYFIRQRLMEIAVRKVFGSTNNEILQRLVFNFVRYVLVAFVIAVPVIWYLMHDWLSQYVYRIPLSWTIFALAGVIALVIAMLTVFGQSWRAANSNPVDSIKR